ncbi:Spo0E family sporulation regulatory protein-aspartic acid phosphatase [Paenibacillus sp. DYY-L-2]|uniref:Spo0E family sporulation regulatory protein-aspartic acid phosphatase n=1 Tax=Paenibacillus sp. DYY-L-2 TaxID=3447013 RepID=UPI003F4F4704
MSKRWHHTKPQGSGAAAHDAGRSATVAAANLDLPALAAEIEAMRSEMEALFDALGNIGPELIDISQRLDGLIFRYMDLKKNEEAG